MQEPLPIKFTYRVIGIDGTIKIYDLPHETSKWSIKFVQAGVVGAAVIGTFEITCPPPASNESMLAQDDLDKIKEQMRVEAYLGDTASGDPLLTGIIRQRPTRMNSFVLKGSDITILAQTALTGRNEQFKGSTSDLVLASIKAYKLRMRDKFNNLTQWSNPGVWTTDTNNGISGIGLNIPAAKHTASATGDGLLLSTTDFTTDDFVDAYLDSLYTLQCGTTPGNIAEGGLVVGADSNNLILGRAQMTCINATAFRIDAEIWKKSGGSYGGAAKKSIKKVINGLKPNQLVKVTMSIKQLGGGNYFDVVSADNPYSFWPLDDAGPLVAREVIRDGSFASGGFNAEAQDTTDVTFNHAGPSSTMKSVQFPGNNGAFAGSYLRTNVLFDGLPNGHVLGGQAAPFFGNGVDWTAEIWFKPTVTTQGATLLGNFTENHNPNWGLTVHGDWTEGVENEWNREGMLLNFAGYHTIDATHSYTFPTNSIWYHIVFRHHASNVCEVYANNVLVATRTIVIPGATGVNQETFQIGGDASINFPYVEGFLSSVAMYDRILGTAEIQSHYNSGAIGPKVEYRVILNGRDSGCSYTENATVTGKVGLRSVSGTVWAANFAFPSKKNIFNPGNIDAGILGVSQLFSNTPMLDRWNISAVTEGVAWRVVRHPFIDSLDWGPNVGDDKTASVHLREGGDLQADSSIEPNTDPPATVIRVSAGAGQDNSGFIEWIDLDAADTYGLVYDPMSAQNVSDTTAQIMLAKKFANLRGNPGVAKVLHFTRTIENAEKFTIGDYIKATSSKLNVFNETVQVMGLDYEEGKADMVATCDQYPSSWSVTDMRRVRQELDALANGTANLSPSSSGGIVYDAKTGSPFILPVWSGYEAIDTTHPMRIRFEVPSNLGVLQKVLVSFSGLPFRAGQQTTSGASTSSTTSSGSAHSHTFTGQSVDSGVFTHVHNMLLKSGASTDAVTSEAGANVFLHNASGSDTTVQVEEDYDDDTFSNQGHTHTLTGVTSNSEGTHTHGMTHTHNINNPTGLHETGMARNVHLWIDQAGVQTDISTLVMDANGTAGPWDGGGSEFDVSAIDITAYLEGGGFHEIQLKTTAPSTVGGIKASIYIFGILQSI